MKLNNLLGVMILVGLFQACTSGSEETTPSGLKYTVVNRGSEGVAPSGSYLMLNMIYKDDTDSVWVDTKDSGVPIMIFKEDSIWAKQDGSIQEIFVELGKGDSVFFDVSANDLFTKTWQAPLPPSIKPETVISFFIGVQDVLDEEGLRAWQQEMQSKQMAKMQEEASGQKIKDAELIDVYLTENNIDAQTTESGLRYVITQEGEGPTPEVGQTVEVNYVGHVLNGEFFDTSIKEIAQEKGLYNEQREPYGPLEFPLGQGAVISGWDEGLALLNKGAKATFYIPSGLAYGARARSEKIPANSILVFDVELVNFK
ncbi:MAG: FKBP-type peptidyl-prolyl cis-trans isomerase [Fulvivirga sp.]|uniref:FKBP-type peptidyl-prolyl cis-trans isomerase n=1 Tax=Fulvivirga sp. TaxID=1931237 RepID=UPI0032EE776C